MGQIVLYSIFPHPGGQFPYLLIRVKEILAILKDTLSQGLAPSSNYDIHTDGCKQHEYDQYDYRQRDCFHDNYEGVYYLLSFLLATGNIPFVKTATSTEPPSNSPREGKCR